MTSCNIPATRPNVHTDICHDVPVTPRGRAGDVDEQYMTMLLQFGLLAAILAWMIYADFIVLPTALGRFDKIKGRPHAAGVFSDCIQVPYCMSPPFFPLG